MDYLKVAKILSPVGLKGEVRVYTTSTFKNKRYKKDNILYYFDKENNIKELKIKNSRNKEGNIDILNFYDIDTFEKAEKLNGIELLALKDEKLLKKDEYYFSDLISSSIYDEDDNLLGVVEGIDEFTSNLSLRMKLNSNNKIIYIPFNDVFVKSVDVNNKKIIIHVIEGLLEI